MDTLRHPSGDPRLDFVITTLNAIGDINSVDEATNAIREHRASFGPEALAEGPVQEHTS